LVGVLVASGAVGQAHGGHGRCELDGRIQRQQGDVVVLHSAISRLVIHAKSIVSIISIVSTSMDGEGTDQSAGIESFVACDTAHLLTQCGGVDGSQRVHPQSHFQTRHVPRVHTETFKQTH